MDGSTFVRLTNSPSLSTITVISRLSVSKPSAVATTTRVAEVCRRPGSRSSALSVSVRVAVAEPVATMSGVASRREPSRHSVSKCHAVPVELEIHTDTSALAPDSAASVTVSGRASISGGAASSTCTVSVSRFSLTYAVTRTGTDSGGVWWRVGSGWPTTTATAAPSPHGVGTDRSAHSEDASNVSERCTAARSRVGSSASAPNSSTVAASVARPPMCSGVAGSRRATIRLIPATATATEAAVPPSAARASIPTADPRATSPICEIVVVRVPVPVAGWATVPAGGFSVMTAPADGRTAPFGKTSKACTVRGAPWASLTVRRLVESWSTYPTGWSGGGSSSPRSARPLARAEASATPAAVTAAAPPVTVRHGSSVPSSPAAGGTAGAAAAAPSTLKRSEAMTDSRSLRIVSDMPGGVSLPSVWCQPETSIPPDSRGIQ